MILYCHKIDDRFPEYVSDRRYDWAALGLSPQTGKWYVIAYAKTGPGACGIATRAILEMGRGLAPVKTKTVKVTVSITSGQAKGVDSGVE